jgi:hypothetical protein
LPVHSPESSPGNRANAGRSPSRSASMIRAAPGSGRVGALSPEDRPATPRPGRSMPFCAANRPANKNPAPSTELASNRTMDPPVCGSVYPSCYPKLEYQSVSGLNLTPGWSSQKCTLDVGNGRAGVALDREHRRQRRQQPRSHLRQPRHTGCNYANRNWRIVAQSGKIEQQDLAGFSIFANQRQMLLTAYGGSVAST